MVTDDIGGSEEVLGSGYTNVGSTCLTQDITTAPGSPNNFAGLMAKYPEIQKTAEEHMRNHPPKE